MNLLLGMRQLALFAFEKNILDPAQSVQKLTRITK
jgi:hypothetical protein